MADVSDRDITINGTSVRSLRVVDLKQELKKRGLSSNGSKSQLISRLVGQLELEELQQKPVEDTDRAPNQALVNDETVGANAFVQEYLRQQEEELRQQKIQRERVRGLSSSSKEEESDSDLVEKAETDDKEENIHVENPAADCVQKLQSARDKVILVQTEGDDKQKEPAITEQVPLNQEQLVDQKEQKPSIKEQRRESSRSEVTLNEEEEEELDYVEGEIEEGEGDQLEGSEKEMPRRKDSGGGEKKSRRKRSGGTDEKLEKDVAESREEVTEKDSEACEKDKGKKDVLGEENGKEEEHEEGEIDDDDDAMVSEEPQVGDEAVSKEKKKSDMKADEKKSKKVKDKKKSADTGDDVEGTLADKKIETKISEENEKELKAVEWEGKERKRSDSSSRRKLKRNQIRNSDSSKDNTGKSEISPKRSRKDDKSGDESKKDRRKSRERKQSRSSEEQRDDQKQQVGGGRKEEDAGEPGEIESAKGPTIRVEIPQVKKYAPVKTRRITLSKDRKSESKGEAQVEESGPVPSKKRRWGSTKIPSTSGKKSSVNISTGTLKEIMPDIKQIQAEQEEEEVESEIKVAEEENPEDDNEPIQSSKSSKKDEDDAAENDESDEGSKKSENQEKSGVEEVKEKISLEGKDEEKDSGDKRKTVLRRGPLEPLKPGRRVFQDHYPSDEDELSDIDTGSEEEVTKENKEIKDDRKERREDEERKSERRASIQNVVRASIDEPVKSASSSVRPAKFPPNNIIHVMNLVRPYTVNQLKTLLGRFGTLQEDGFWIDSIKSHCYVTFLSTEEAVACREALQGTTWPNSNPKNLNLEFATKDELDRQLGKSASKPKPLLPLMDQKISRDSKDGLTSRSKREEKNLRLDQATERLQDTERRMKERIDRQAKQIKEKERRPLEREWDKGKDRERSLSREREKRRRERSREKKEAAEKAKGPSSEPPAKLLDDLFKKTKATPCIYWLPLTEEAYQKRMKEKEERKKQREMRIQEEEKQKRERERAVNKPQKEEPKGRSPRRRSRSRSRGKRR